MDKIFVRDLEVFAHHGVMKQEKELGQKFLISLELFLDLKEAGKSDDLSKTVNYGELCHEAEKEFQRESYDLIERAAERLAEFILLHYNEVEEVKVVIKKPWAPIGRSLLYAGVEINRVWHKAFLGMGSNLGNKLENLNTAINKINKSTYTKITKISENYETKPVGNTEQDNFINCAVEVRTLLTPRELIRFLLEVEDELKRKRVIKWGPRTIDLDVLLYDNIITSFEEIIIPHPRMHERLFVLKPLKDIAPYFLHPILNKRIIEIEEQLSKEQEII
jgi:dihydroneopterin aldolase/2-amino-4-hydroxy-6-hydroxymethyldihydropteridine diphosphokinase